MTHIPVLIPLTLLLGALLVMLTGQRRRSLAYPLAVATVAIAGTLGVVGLVHVTTVETLRYTLGGWIPPIGIEYVLDPLSAFMVAVVLGVATFVMVHSRAVIERELPGRAVAFYAVALLLLTGFAGMLITGDLFNLYVFLEISSLAGYALIAVGERASPVAAFRYLLVGTIGASFYLLGLGFLYLMTGSLNMTDVAHILPGILTEPPVIVALILMVVGIAIKMAIFPLHGWLPDAYTLAPSPASALIAPIGTKVGAYVLIRVMFYVFDPAYVSQNVYMTDVLLWLSMAGIIIGSIMAMAQTELKRMLAYSSVAQIGYIGLGIGLANPLGLIGAVLHVLNHAFMKSSLFLVAGNMRSALGHSTIPKFDDTMRKAMPWTMASFSVAALSMVGIPPTAGFFSKWYLVLGGVEASNWIAVTVILLSSLLNAVYFFRVLEKVYMRKKGEPETGDGRTENGVIWKEVKMAMLVPTLVLSFGLIILGLANALIVQHAIKLMIPAGM